MSGMETDKFLGFRVIARDDLDPGRVAIVDGRNGGAVIVDNVLHDIGRKKVDTALSSSGIWTDEDLPTIQELLARVEMTV